MPESVQVAIIGVIGVLLGGAVVWFINLKKMPKEIRVLNSQEAVNMTTALNEAIAALVNSVKAANEDREAWNAEREVLTRRIEELEVHKNERARLIYEIQQKQEKSEREYVAMIATLQTKISNLQAQISEADKRYESLKKQTLRMYQALQESSISIDIDPEFRDTLERMKAVK